MTRPDRPSPPLREAQSAWLAPLRSRLLRRAGVAHRQRALDLGAGDGQGAAELLRRGVAQVVALDRVPPESPPAGVSVVRAEATALPFAAEHFDLVLCQLALLWMPLDEVLDEIVRVLRPGGVLVALEPDYGGLLEDPPAAAVRPLWESALHRAGADPHVGRKLPGALSRRGLLTEVLLPSRVEPPHELRFDLLDELPLEAPERAALHRARAAARSAPAGFAYLPVLGLLAVKPDPATALRRTSPRPPAPGGPGTG